jgi:DNA (cytosine-5)-methyltransferase 1
VFTFGSLFSGIGGLDLGLERAGWVFRWQLESDPFRALVLARHWNVTRYSDIRAGNFEQVESVDLIAGGFPCQPVSSAGKRQVQGDERWLWPEFARAVRGVRPRFVLIENVAGLLERGFGDVLSDLADCGYDAEWQMLPATIVGAPHIRARVWIVAYSREGGFCQQSDIEADTPLVFCGGFADSVCAALGEAHHWRTEPEMVRMVDGLSNGMGRYIAALGDAVVPQAAEFVGRLLLQAASLSNQRMQPTPAARLMRNR